MTKKIISLIVVLSLCFSLSSTAFAAGNLSETAQTEKAFELLSVDDASFYSYKDDNITYVSQITDDNVVQFSYMLAGDDLIYSSDIFYVSDFLLDIGKSLPSEKHKENYRNDVNNLIIANLNEYKNLEQIRVDNAPGSFSILDSNSAGGAKSNLSTMLTTVFGNDYGNTLLGFSNKSHNGSKYTVYCHENQYTNQLNTKSFAFAAQVSLTVIATWILNGGFSMSVIWFLGALGAALETINGIQRIVNSLSGTLYAYTCNRSRQITVGGYPYPVYLAAWTIKTEFVNGNGIWDTSTYYNRKDYDYSDVSALMATGFSNYVNYYL